MPKQHNERQQLLAALLLLLASVAATGDLRSWSAAGCPGGWAPELLVSRTTGTGAERRNDGGGVAGAGGVGAWIAGVASAGVGRGGGGGGADATCGGEVSRCNGGANWTSAITFDSSAPPADFLSLGGVRRPIGSRDPAVPPIRWSVMAISCVYCGGRHETSAEVRECWSREPIRDPDADRRDRSWPAPAADQLARCRRTRRGRCRPRPQRRRPTRSAGARRVGPRRAQPSSTWRM